MGEKLVEHFQSAYKIGGLFAQMRLAMITKTPSTLAAILPDTTENISRFQEALIKLNKEMKH